MSALKLYLPVLSKPFKTIMAAHLASTGESKVLKVSGYWRRLRDRERVLDRSMIVRFPSKDLVMGQVKILKCGEELKPMKDGELGVVGNDRKVRFEGEDDLVLSLTDRLGLSHRLFGSVLCEGFIALVSYGSHILQQSLF